MFRLNANKYSGLDDICPTFYKFEWSILGKDVIQSITHLCLTYLMPAATNAIILTLVLKKYG